MAKSKLKKKVLKFLLSFPISFSLTVCPFTPGHIDVVINSIFTIEQPQGIIDSPIAEAQGLIYPVEPLSPEKNEIEVGSATDRTQSGNKFVANCSAYTADPAECGGNATGITASGKKAVEGRTIAMDDVPLGTKVKINGKVYVVEDRFGGDYKRRIDIYFDSKKDAEKFGRQYLEVEIVDD